VSENSYSAFLLLSWSSTLLSQLSSGRTMHQPPEAFGRVMANMPGPVVFLFFPFETLWTRARAGALDVGDPAPDFSLLKVDKSGSVQLSVLNKQQPIVLVFGSSEQYQRQSGFRQPEK